jgi:putative tricarboxylic transport membrane protein
MKKGNLIVSIIFASIAVAVILLSRTLPESRHGVPGPAIWPILIAMLTLVAAIALAIQMRTTKGDGGSLNLVLPDSLRVYLSFGVLVVYLAGMYWIGFAVSTFLMLYIFISWFGSFRWQSRLLSAVAITAVVYGVFHYLLKVPFRFGFLF